VKKKTPWKCNCGKALQSRLNPKKTNNNDRYRNQGILNESKRRR
jgi:hypothetical protein